MQLPQSREGVLFLSNGGTVPPHNTIYQTTVTQLDSGIVETYTGLASTNWKARLAVHKKSIMHKPKPKAKSSNGTDLSTYILEPKDQSIYHTLS